MADAEKASRWIGNPAGVGHFRSHRHALEATTVVVVMIGRAVFVLVVVAVMAVVMIVTGLAAVAGILCTHGGVARIRRNGAQAKSGENAEHQQPCEKQSHERPEIAPSAHNLK